MTDFNLSEHFTFFELTSTSDADLRLINRADGADFVIPLSVLCEELLENIFRMFGAKPTITSGHRCAFLNEKLGGAQDSQHLKGEAADFVKAEA